MCGITGYWYSNSKQTDAVLRSIVTHMALAIAHRGPDDAGVWFDDSVGIALGHRRLAIIDLSAAGHQPMHAISGRYVMVFNGEIYNHMEIRAELEEQRRGGFCGGKSGVSWDDGVGVNDEAGEMFWRGHSDTETLLAAFECWGVGATLKRCIGMFSIALWDREASTLALARDRFGEKPLYYGWVGGGAEQAFVFGSEMKSLRAYPGFANPVCRRALTQYMRFSYVPAPRSIYQGIYKLEPGCLLTIQGMPPSQAPKQPLRAGQTYGGLHVHRWWALADVVEQSTGNKEPEGVQLQLLQNTLANAVQNQSISDVPLGAFLSGGVDSSTIVALMQQQVRERGTDPVQTFTIGFDEAGFNESTYAQAVAAHLGTRHHEMRVTAQMAQDVIPTLPGMYDEPFADSSQIPTHLVCQAARQHVTVALSGDAGDELFGGYNRYFWGPRIWKRLGHWPYPLRQSLAKGLASVPAGAWNVLGAPWQHQPDGVARLGEKSHKLADALRGAADLDGLYRNLVSTWHDPGQLVRGEDGSGVPGPSSLLDDPLPACGLDSPPLRMMYQDAMSYLPDDILCKVDRAAMAVSLETRVPFLDHRVVEMAWRLPLDMKIRGNTGKWALRQILYQYVPKELIERPKAGFAIPIGQWLRGPLREWAEVLLDECRLEAEGYFHPGPIRAVWQEHLSGRRDHTPKLWAILMFQAWLEENSRPAFH